MKKLILIIIFICMYGGIFSQILPGANQTNEYIGLLKNKKVGVVTNQSGIIGNTHLVDSLISLNTDIVKVFAPEHGFRGKAEAGAYVKDGRDLKTGLEIVSLYGNNKKPSNEQLAAIDIMIFDLQGVGARFYTYISSLTYIMEACAENDIPLIVLDRPNPNAHYVDGPVLKNEYKSFVGVLPIPVVYGMTDGELALMINGEGWLKNEIKCELTIIKIKNYSHQSEYKLPIKPSPNLPNYQSVYLYPSLCFFEGTPISIGRGTDKPFQIIGYPGYTDTSFCFQPKSILGVSANPKFKNEYCYGVDLSSLYDSLSERPKQLDLKYLIDFYQTYKEKGSFFNGFFNKLAGNSDLQEQIKRGVSAQEIRESWRDELEEFRRKRSLYLLYGD